MKSNAVFIGLLVLVLTSADAVGQSIVVSAGDHDRNNTIVSFDAPESLGAGSLSLVAGDGTGIPLQIDGYGTAWFVLDHLAAGSSIELRIDPADDTLKSIRVSRSNGSISFTGGDQPLLSYREAAGPLPRGGIDASYARGGYLHPVRTPMGRTVTDDYPRNHIHHHGIWAAWTKTEFDGRTPDFWNMRAETGTVLVDSVSSVWSGNVHAGLTAHHRYVDLSADSPVDALYERWIVRAYGIIERDRPYHVLDLELKQTTASDEPLVLPEYRYGGVGFRGAWEWNGPDNTAFLTSEGRDRSDGHATRARWCHIGGTVDGRLTGITMMDHPENFGAPQPMRIHPTEPFFNYAPSQAGDWSIRPGEPYTVRYRFVVYDGRPNPEVLDQLWRDYADPPVVDIIR